MTLKIKDGLVTTLSILGVAAIILGIFNDGIGFSTGLIVGICFFFATGIVSNIFDGNIRSAVLSFIILFGVIAIVNGLFGGNFISGIGTGVFFFVITAIVSSFWGEVPYQGQQRKQKNWERNKGNLVYQKYITPTKPPMETVQPPRITPNRRILLERILNRYTEIDLDEMAKLLEFSDTLELQRFLLELPNDAPLKIQGKKVIIVQAENAAMNQVIDDLSSKFDQWEQSERIRAGKTV